MTADQDPGIVPQAVDRATQSPDSPLVPAVDTRLTAEPAVQPESIMALAKGPDMANEAAASTASPIPEVRRERGAFAVS